MNHTPAPPEFDRFRQLMTQAIDGELKPEEQTEFDRLLAESPERRQEWKEHQKIKAMTMNMHYAEPPPEVWDRYWIGVYRRLERGAAWILTSIGAMILLFYGGYKLLEEIMHEPELPWLIKGGILVLLAGLIILFVSVAREKLFTRKTDRYQEIQR